MIEIHRISGIDRSELADRYMRTPACGSCLAVSHIETDVNADQVQAARTCCPDAARIGWPCGIPGRSSGSSTVSPAAGRLQVALQDPPCVSPSLHKLSHSPVNFLGLRGSRRGFSRVRRDHP
jgi:hypothetical protein